MARVVVACATLALCLLLLAAVVLNPLFVDGGQWSVFSCIIRVCVALPLLVLALFLGDICTLQPSDSHSARSLAIQYIILRLLPIYTSTVRSRFVAGTKDIQATQERFLLEALQENANTDYGREYNFKSIRNREQFVQQHPITGYKHYEDYIQRVCNGDENVMCARELSFVGLSSGTTGKFKRIPIFSGAFIQFVSNLGFVIGYTTKKANTLQRIAALRFKAKDRFTEKGVPMGPLSSHFAPLPPYAVTPLGAGMIQSEHKQCYVTALFSLAERNLQHIDGLLAPVCLTFFKTIEQNADQLVSDIRAGRLFDGLDVDDDVRRTVNEHLKADPKRADEVQKELGKGSDNLALRLWPCLRVVLMATSGEFEASARLLRASFLKEVFVVSAAHGATEGSIGVNLDSSKDSITETPTYAFSHSTAFLEFIPEDNIGEENPKTLFLDQLELGHSYEIVVTNTNGFYRYRLGDVIRVTGYFNQDPLYKFLYRSGQLLSVKGEKTSSADFYEALRSSEREWKGKHLVNFSATESPNLEIMDEFKSTVKGKCYFLFIEVAYLDQNKTCILSKEEKQMIDEHLQRLAKMYGVCRTNGSIGPMQVIQVKQGTFARLKDITTKGAINQQYKTPRALRNPEFLAFLLEREVRIST